jgi:transcriptional regulator with XRE-family HTH domain
MGLQSRESDDALLAEIGERLARARLERDLTQATLAKDAGVSRITIARLEAGQPVSSRNLVRVLRVLGLLEALDRLLPTLAPSPIEMVALAGRPRRRASGHDRRGPAGAEPGRPPWRWGDEDPTPP